MRGAGQFWADYEQRLTAHPGFGENPEARKAFAKLRTALASLYADRAMYDEAESAFRQALRLYPTSPEANLRLAKMLGGQQRAEEARRVLETYLATDPQDAREEAEAYLKELGNRGETPPSSPDH